MCHRYVRYGIYVCVCGSHVEHRKYLYAILLFSSSHADTHHMHAISLTRRFHFSFLIADKLYCFFFFLVRLVCICAILTLINENLSQWFRCECAHWNWSCQPWVFTTLVAWDADCCCYNYFTISIFDLSHVPFLVLLLLLFLVVHLSLSLSSAILTIFVFVVFFFVVSPVYCGSGLFCGCSRCWQYLEMIVASFLFKVHSDGALSLRWTKRNSLIYFTLKTNCSIAAQPHAKSDWIHWCTILHEHPPFNTI